MSKSSKTPPVQDSDLFEDRDEFLESLNPSDRDYKLWNPVAAILTEGDTTTTLTDEGGIAICDTLMDLYRLSGKKQHAAALRVVSCPPTEGLSFVIRIAKPQGNSGEFLREDESEAITSEEITARAAALLVLRGTDKKFHTVRNTNPEAGNKAGKPSPKSAALTWGVKSA